MEVLAKLLRFYDVLRSSDDNVEQLPEIGRRLVEAAPQYGIFRGLHAAAIAYVTTLFPLRRGRPAEETERLRKDAYASAKTAMELDPKQMAGLVDSVRAIIVDASRDLAERERLLQRSISSDPSFLLLYYCGIFLERVGRTDDARTNYLRAGNDFPPSAYMPLTRAAELAASAGAMFMAQQSFVTIGQTWPTDGPRFWSEFWYGDPVIAKQLAQEKPYARVIDPSQRSCVDAFLDARVKRIDLSEGQINAASGSNHEAYYASFGLVDYWLDSGHWPDFCTTGKLADDCKEAARAARAGRVLLTPRKWRLRPFEQLRAVTGHLLIYKSCHQRIARSEIGKPIEIAISSK